MSDIDLQIYSFYRFVKIGDKERYKIMLEHFLQAQGNIKGTILIADEGINGAISGKKDDLQKIILFIKKILKVRKLSLKINNVDFLPFNRLKLRLKKEIVSLGIKNLNITKNKAKYIKPSQWDSLIKNKEVKLIDTRNNYEIPIGSFEKSINPSINSFRDFPTKFNNLKLKKNQKIAMYCTGGIRCEKASAYLKSRGYKNVYQLEGGILNYLDFKKNSLSKNSWKGECFVFDKRVTVNKKLISGKYKQCHGCRMPLSKKDISSKFYIKGVSCIYCYDNRSKEQKNKSLMRLKQIDLSNKKGIDHVFKRVSDL